MSLTRAQVQIIARTEPFSTAIREALAVLNRMSPLLWKVSLPRQRTRSRAVTRRKQRSHW